MLYQVLERMIAQGKTTGLREKIDVFYAVGSITEEQYTMLVAQM